MHHQRGAGWAGLWFTCAVLCVSGCTTTAPRTVRVEVDNPDTTPPTVLTLQVRAPGQPAALVMDRQINDPNFPDVTVEVGPNDQVQLTLVAKDEESGIQRLELAGLLTTYRLSGTRWVRQFDHISKNFGVSAILPLTLPQDYPVSQSLDGVIDFSTLTASADWVIIELVAVAQNGSPQMRNTDSATRIVSLVFKKAGSPPGP